MGVVIILVIVVVVVIQNLAFIISKLSSTIRSVVRVNDWCDIQLVSRQIRNILEELVAIFAKRLEACDEWEF